MTLIQSKAGQSASTASLVITLDAVPRTGSFLFVTAALGATKVISTIGGGSSSPALAWRNGIQGSGTTTAEIWFAGPVATGSAAITITVPAATKICATVFEYDGLRAPSVNTKDLGTENSGSTTAMTTGSRSNTVPDELVVVCAGWDGADTYSTGPDNSCVRLPQSAIAGSMVLESGFRELNSLVTLNVGWTKSGTNPWGAAIVYFYRAPASQFVGPNPSPSRILP